MCRLSWRRSCRIELDPSWWCRDGRLPTTATLFDWCRKDLFIEGLGERQFDSITLRLAIHLISVQVELVDLALRLFDLVRRSERGLTGDLAELSMLQSVQDWTVLELDWLNGTRSTYRMGVDGVASAATHLFLLLQKPSQGRQLVTVVCAKHGASANYEAAVLRLRCKVLF